MSGGVFAVFPGQGSQAVGMGVALGRDFPAARELFARADEALGFSLSGLCASGPDERLTLTEFAQPAILTVSVACFSLFGGGVPVTAAAGHSLGEFSALVAAGALGFEDAVRLVHRRGRYMQEAVAAGAGAMVAVLGRDLADVEALAAAVDTGVAEVANVNAVGQIVVSGDVAGVERFCALAGGKLKRLAVSAPFHSSLMRPAADRLAEDLRSVTFREPAFPVYANVTARPAPSPARIREDLVEQVAGRVRWTECVANAVADTAPSLAAEYGHGSVLTSMMKRVGTPVRAFAVGDRAGAEVVADALRGSGRAGS